MLKKPYLYLLCLLVFTGGCVASLQSTDQTQIQEIEVPPMIPMELNQMSPDIKLVTAALMEKMRGNNRQIPGVTFDPAGRHDVGEQDFHYENFNLKGMSITNYAVTESQPDQVEGRLEGMMVFTDSIDRCTSIFFATMYTVSQKKIVIDKSMTIQLPPAIPSIDLFFVPSDKLKATEGTLADYTSLYLFCLENAVPMTVEDGESKISPEDNYLIIAFCRERMASTSLLEMKVTDKKDMRGAEVSETAYINDHGWRIMLSGGKFRPGSYSNRFYIGVGYKDNPRSDDPPIIVATFENKKRIRQEPQTEAAAAVPTDQPLEQTQSVSIFSGSPSGAGSLEKGLSLLNPITPEDVGIIQTRLKDLGLYKGAIDNDMGPMTRKSLDTFTGQNGFPQGQWSLELQKALFRGSGQ